MVKTFEQFDLFKVKSETKTDSTNPSKKGPPPFPNVLLSSISESDARVNAVYYLRIVNKSALKRLYVTSTEIDKKLFFLSLLNEIKLKQGRLNPVSSCRDTTLKQALTLARK